MSDSLERALGISVSYADWEKRLAAWNNVPSIPGKSYKMDCDGRYIVWDEYGKYTEFGWHADHAWASVVGGPDVLANFRARHWKGNTAAGGLLSGFSRLRSIQS